MNGFPEYDTKRLSGGRRSLVLSVGILSIALSLAGLVTYAVVQVPSLRSLYGEYQFENHYLNSLAYYSELIIIVTFTCLGLLVNILLVLGVHKNKRWYLVHWMIYHGLAMTGLFITSILVFVIQTHLLKLIGLAPLAVIVVVAFIWIQVHKLFEEMSPPPENDNESELYPPPPFLASHPLGPAPFMIGGPGPPAWETGSVTSDYEFYPVDPISRGLWKRLNLHPYLPFSHPMDQNPTARARQSFLNPRLEDADYSSSLRTGRFFRFYDIQTLDHEDESLDGDCDRDERDGGGEGNIDFKSSGSSLNI